MFKKSQGFYADFLIGLLILIFITFIFTRTILDLNSHEDILQGLINDGTSISNSLMSEGYCPTNQCSTDWSNMKGRLGFVKNGKIIADKFNAYAALESIDYPKTKALLGTNNDYVLYFEYNNQIISNIYGKYDNLNQITEDNRVKITRILYYNLDGNGGIVNMIVLVFN